MKEEKGGGKVDQEMSEESKGKMEKKGKQRNKSGPGKEWKRVEEELKYGKEEEISKRNMKSG